MVDFTFRGFTNGAAVAITATQGTSQASGSVTTWGQGNLASFDIAVHAQDTVVAPAAIWFEAENLSGFTPGGPGTGLQYDPRLHEITYIWTIQGSPNPDYDAPVSIVDEWNDANKAYGPKVVLPFFDPGTYTVECFAIDADGNSGTESIQVTVEDPDTVYPGTRTIVVALDGNHAGAPSGAQTVTSLPAAQSIIDAASQPHRLLLKRGETFPTFEIKLDGNGLGYVGDWGGGAKPVLDLGEVKTESGTQVVDFTCVNIRFRGTWDTTDGSGNGSYAPISPNLSFQQANYHWFGCEFEAAASVTGGTKNNNNDQIPNTTMAFTNCVITGWRDYGIFVGASTLAPGSRWSLVGCRLSQNINSRSGWDFDPGNNHGPLRLSSIEDVYIGVNDFFSRSGHANTDQPCMRLNTDSELGCYINIDRFVGEGGNQVIQLQGGPSNLPARPGNYIIDKALVMGTVATEKQLINSAFGGTTFRNVLGVKFNVQSYNNFSWDGCIDLSLRSGPGQANNNEDNPVAIYSCSFLSLLSATNDRNWGFALNTNEAGYTDLTVENNVRHAPSIDAPETPDMPVDISSLVSEIATRHRGVRLNGQSMQTQFGIDGENPPLIIPQPGSAAYQTASSGRVAYDDFFGKVRGPAPSRGAIEPV